MTGQKNSYVTACEILVLNEYEQLNLVEPKVCQQAVKALVKLHGYNKYQTLMRLPM